MLMEKPIRLMAAKVPIRETGIVISGIRVARQSCRNIKITTSTRAIAIQSVVSTSAMASSTKMVVSKGI